jgi:hypothetical protein
LAAFKNNNNYINKIWGCGDNKGYIVCEVAP